ncbi:aminotransferase [Dactylonectria estremocensis]|uniref:Aminotransferase n=1 Tax=Dactylonectria estremocensis TaxID=1079267 RepID=A0A9P9EZY2_9HYPO|nr:aminotransferase [Dactylonectria estremocensis]
MSDEFSLFTSLRYDSRLREVPAMGITGGVWNTDNESPLYMLDFHRDRMLRAASHWKWQAAIDALAGDDGLRNLARMAQEAVGSSQTSPLRLRFLVSREGEITTQKFDTPEKPLENMFPGRLPPPGSSFSRGDPTKKHQFTLLVDQPVTPRSEYTHYKTTKRDMYDSARQRANISPADPKELLIINKNDGSVMEGTVTTPYFWRNGQWVTPPVATTFSWEDGSGGQDGTSRRWALQRGLATEQVVRASSLVDGEECWISNGVRGFIYAKLSLEDQQ